jgi:para-nitrobenzyl esterase
MTKKLLVLMAAAVVPAGLLMSPAAASPTIVRTDAGLVASKTVGDARVYDGIPYAAPPVGALRWKAPQAAKPWNGVRESKLGNPCPQQANSEVPDGASDEDCLYLNVTAPSAPSKKPRAVVVWLPGGGFFSGAGNSYEASKFAARGDVVVVTVNYRLGIFGFFGYPGLPGSGTYGLQDQQAALRWVQRNARAFGGDPRNVTVAGESAGGMSVCAQLTSPTATGLFAKAIMQSGSCAFNWADNSQYPGQTADSPWIPAARVQANGKEWADGNKATLGCKPGQAMLDCLRSVKSDVLVDDMLAFTQIGYGGSAVVPLDPARAMKSGLFHRVPIISGNNHDEANGWAAAFGDIKDYPQLVRNMVGAEKADARIGCRTRDGAAVPLPARRLRLPDVPGATAAVGPDDRLLDGVRPDRKPERTGPAALVGHWRSVDQGLVTGTNGPERDPAGEPEHRAPVRLLAQLTICRDRSARMRIATGDRSSVSNA